jgi:hypothetical protein
MKPVEMDKKPETLAHPLVTTAAADHGTRDESQLHLSRVLKSG